MEWEKRKPNASAGVVPASVSSASTFLGVSPLAGGEKAKVQFKPKTDIGEEGKCLTCKAVEEHSSISPASHRLGRSEKHQEFPCPDLKEI